MVKTQTAYAIYDGDELAVINCQLPIYWHRSNAVFKCPVGMKVRKVEIAIVPKRARKPSPIARGLRSPSP